MKVLRRPHPIWVLTSCVAWLAIQPVFAAAASGRVEKRVRSATLEVVVKLPDHDPLSYEKPLPIELLPFALRNATHLPIGTAFCIGRNRYVSAAHVVAAPAGGQYGAPQLRDESGNTYEIAEIHKYSNSEDFAVFSLQNPPAQQALPINEQPQPNSTVFAVGNALGEGIIIRDGLYTSSTPEQLDGQWNWLRFSAAASPGNSGGPLLDASGRVIGVIIGASPNENLNFALPIGNVTAARDGLARFVTRMLFRLPFAPESVVLDLTDTVRLPLTYDQFAEAMLELSRKNFEQGRDDLLRTTKESYFPQGAESLELLYRPADYAEARLIVKKDGKWVAHDVDNKKTGDLGNGGWIVAGTIADIGVSRMYLPDDVAVADLAEDSKRFMDLYLKGVPLTRFVGPEAIAMTSLGPALQSTTYTDRYGRRWLLRTWHLPFMDGHLATLSLPVPDGFLTLTQVGPTSLAYPRIEVLKMAADLVYVSYTGTLDRWRAFMGLASYRPTVFERIGIEFETDRLFSFRSPLFDLSVDTSLQNIKPDSHLNLVFTYFHNNQLPVWDVGGLFLLENPRTKTGVGVARLARPPESLGRKYLESWDAVRERRRPNDSGPYLNDGRMNIQTALTRSAGPERKIDETAQVIYQVTYMVNAPFTDDVMRSLYRTLLDNLQIHEE